MIFSSSMYVMLGILSLMYSISSSKFSHSSSLLEWFPRIFRATLKMASRPWANSISKKNHDKMRHNYDGNLGHQTDQYQFTIKWNKIFLANGWGFRQCFDTGKIHPAASIGRFEWGRELFHLPNTLVTNPSGNCEVKKVRNHGAA